MLTNRKILAKTRFKIMAKTTPIREDKRIKIGEVRKNKD